MKKVFIPIVLIGLMGMSSCKFLEKHRLFSKNVDTLLDVPAKTPEIMPIDTTPIVYEEPVVEPIESASAMAGYGTEKYYMIAGSFQNERFAQKYAEKMKEMGYNSRIIEGTNGFFRVSVKAFDDFSQGVGEIEDFRSSLSAGAWLHVKK